MPDPQDPQNQTDMLTALMALYGGNAMKGMAKSSGAAKAAARAEMEAPRAVSFSNSIDDALSNPALLRQMDDIKHAELNSQAKALYGRGIDELTGSQEAQLRGWSDPATLMSDTGQPNPVGAAVSGHGLPMDQASRMARAREMGFDVENPVYHGTNAQFDEFKPSDRGALGPGVYFSKIPGVAANYGMPGEYVVRGNILNTGPFRDIPDGLTEAIKSQLTQEELKRWDRMWPGTHDVYGNPKLPPDSETFREVLTRSVEPSRVPEIMRKAGYDGMQGIADGHELTVFDPSNIRSVNAAFDPAKADSANLLASDTGKPSLLGSALTAIQNPDNRPEWMKQLDALKGWGT